MRKLVTGRFGDILLATACLYAAVSVCAGEWAYLPPPDVDPKLAALENPIPRRWSGQKAALAFARIAREPTRVTLTWSDAAAARKAPKLKGDPRSLWRG
ncbi:MAG: hypothetical protein IJI36_19200, partial [Kiritimatiellae bacterium]|nr:hypothetical protein [Kiritimatiellia bacterium]